MKKTLENRFKNLAFATVTIGGQEIDFPIIKRWRTFDHIVIEAVDIIKMLIGFGTVVAVAMIVVSGYTLITSTGNPDKIEQGQKTLTGAVIGLIIVWVAGLVIATILKGLKVQ